MTTPDPQKENDNILITLIKSFFSPDIPPYLRFGGLAIIVVLLALWWTGTAPREILWVIVLVAIIYPIWDLMRHRPTPPPPDPKDPKDPTGGEDPPQKKTIDDYLHDLLKQCEFVSLDTLDDDSTDQDRSSLALSTVFTSLDVQDNRQSDDPQERMRSEEERREPALARLGRDPYLVLLGEAGSGKSTLVNFVALCMAGQKLGREEANLDQMAGWSGRWYLPVRVILRDYAAQGQGLLAGQTLWQFISTQLGDEQVGLASYIPELQRTLEKEGGLLLLDGLDEVPEADERREELRTQILRFKSDFPKVRILVTSRPYAYAQIKWQLPKPFASEQLLDFSPEQIEQYIDQRYGLLAEGQPKLERERIGKSAEELKGQIKRRKDLRELAVRPLLLVLITSLHRWQGGRELPKDRQELYDMSVNRLLQKWQQGKRIDDQQLLPLMSLLDLNLVKLRFALSKVAYTVHKEQAKLEGTADIPVSLLAGELHAVANKEVDTHTIIGYLKNRAGLLQERWGVKGKEVYAFVHRTFQEYLAACYIIDEDEWDTAEKFAQLATADSTRWREALLLASKRAGTDTAWEMIKELWPKRQPPVAGEAGVLQNAEQWGIFLASEIWRENSLWENLAVRRHELRDKQQAWSVALLNQEQGEISPADRAVLGMVLGQLDDPRAGVGVKEGLPDVVWGGVVKAGKYTIGDGKHDDEAMREVEIAVDYQLAKYPITNAQFQCFVEADDFSRVEWWKGMPEKEAYGKVQEIASPQWAYLNHPRERVTWYQAVAFARWLSDKLGYEVRLPHEHEWEVAAKYQHGRTYPWGDDFDSTKANTAEGGLGQTTAVGLYPTGRQPTLDLYDMSGNVWEWCQNQYEDPTQDKVDESGNSRVLRGGSWYRGGNFARAACRNGGHHPYDRSPNLGLRLVRCVRPPSHAH